MPKFEYEHGYKIFSIYYHANNNVGWNIYGSIWNKIYTNVESRIRSNISGQIQRAVHHEINRIVGTEKIIISDKTIAYITNQINQI